MCTRFVVVQKQQNNIMNCHLFLSNAEYENFLKAVLHGSEKLLKYT